MDELVKFINILDVAGIGSSLNEDERNQFSARFISALKEYGYVLVKKGTDYTVIEKEGIHSNKIMGLKNSKIILNFLYEHKIKILFLAFLLFLIKLLNTKRLEGDRNENKIFLANQKKKIERKGEEKKGACKMFKGLNYTGNSCYQDSVLIALFSIPNAIITKNILKKPMNNIYNSRRWIMCTDDEKKDFLIRNSIQKELIKITNSMREGDDSVKTCSNLRKMVRGCSRNQTFWTTQMQDAGEFITFLFNLFQVDIAHTVNETYYGNRKDKMVVWETKSIHRDKNSSPIIDITNDHLIEENGLITSDFLTLTERTSLDAKNLARKDGKTYSEKKLIRKIISSDYLVFNVYRTKKTLVQVGDSYRVKEVFTPVSIFPLEKIQTNVFLNLHAIVVFQRKHYSCFIKCGNTWFYYDDNPGGKSHVIVKIGTYSNMLASKPSPLDQGILYFYSKN